MKIRLRKDHQEIILTTLLTVGMITVAIAAPNALQLFKYVIPRNSKDRHNIKQSLSRLERRGYLRRTNKNGEAYYFLTSSGQARAKRYELNITKIKPSSRWDGNWRLVMFDVPEDKKLARRAVNLALKKLGCVQYQKSVFITPYPCKKEIDFVGDVFNIRKHIRVVTAHEIEASQAFKKEFNL